MRAGAAIETFVDQLSNWYVRRNRRRFWKAASGADKQAAYLTLYECLEVVTRLLAPFVPFIEAGRRCRGQVRADDGTFRRGPRDPVPHFPRGSSPEKALRRRRNAASLSMIVCNIHAGEVEGKEAALMLARDMAAFGTHADLMKHATIVVVPLYNPDGNDRIDVKHRALDLKAMDGQVGPEGGVGTRYTGAGINLNRDYTKLEAVESRALMALFGSWNPHLFVDSQRATAPSTARTRDTPHADVRPREPILYCAT